jgi:predicted ATP-grasp superfamily ATP-dependent carboligase
MNVLITSSRMPAALDEIRKFGICGHRVFAGDTLRTAPGSYSRYVEDRFRFAPPQREPWAFVAEVRDFVVSRGVDLVVPCSEEVFYFAQNGASLAEVTQVFVAPFAALAQLHNKASFHALVAELRVDAPETEVVTDRRELARALLEHSVYVARPVWSRGGTEILSNAEAFPHSMRVDECDPTEDRPWIVQRYIGGTDVCSFSVARHGRITAHAAYEHPRTFAGGGGIVFESIDEPRTLDVARRVVEATQFHGQISFDFRRDGGRLYVLECNPRPTAGVHLLRPEALVDAIVGPVRGRPTVAPPGRTSVYALALVRDMVMRHRDLRESLAYLRENDDFFAAKGDRRPGLYQILSYSHVMAHRSRHRRHGRRGTSMIAAYFDGVTWDGEPVPFPSRGRDRRLGRGLRPGGRRDGPPPGSPSPGAGPSGRDSSRARDAWRRR